MADAYRPGVHDRLDELEQDDPDLYDTVIDAIEFVFDQTGKARHQAHPLLLDGTQLFATVVQHHRTPPHYVLWQMVDGDPVIVTIAALEV
jgi:hypothetical protein